MIKKHLLFLYMVPETGHQKAAEAIMKTASLMDPRVECIGIDAVRHAPIIGNMFNRMYIQMLKRAPVIWEYLYDNPDVELATRDARGILTLLGSFRTRKILKKHQPAVVICTQAIPATAMAAEKKKGKLKSPLICAITDFGVHSYWIHPEIDLYLVGHEDVKKTLIEKGIRPERIRVTGIPINPKFGESADPAEERRRLKLSPHKKTILLMGGSRGLGGMENWVEALKSVSHSFQCLVVCGRNRKLQQKISRNTRGMENIHTLGYVKNLPQIMSASDILISKPGGLTSSEALARQLPMILTNPIPGQEERNVRFLTHHKAAILARTPKELTTALNDLLKHPNKITKMTQHAKLISKPLSAWESARLIFDTMNGRGQFQGNNPGKK